MAFFSFTWQKSEKYLLKEKYFSEKFSSLLQTICYNMKKYCRRKQGRLEQPMGEISLQSVWNSFYESMILVDKAGRIVSANNAAKHLFSLNTTKYENTSIFEFIPEAYQQYFSLQNKTTGLALSFGTKDLLMTIYPLQQCVLLIFNNVTEKQQLKYEYEKLKEQLHAFEAILDKLDVGICFIDTEKKILFYNKKIGEINAREPNSVKNKYLFDAFPNLEEENSKIVKTLRLAKSLKHREIHYTNAGVEQTIISETHPIYLGNRLIGSLEILHDITKQKQLEQLIQQMNREQNERNKAMKDCKPSNNTRFTFKDIVYRSREMGRIVEQAKKVAQTSSNVLIFGETGTGKELFAQSIHNESKRKDHKFIAQNCAAIPENLLEGLLFGTTTGSFTGAVNRPGIFEQAHKGTLLLDEINSISLDLQAKLLRVLQEKKVRRLGSDKEIDIDVRVIATMNEDPMEAIKKGKLREDLYYRISVVNLHIKPLRKRKIDIAALIDYFIEKHSKALGIEVEGIDDNVYDLFINYPWPGNVRQLENTIEGALNLMYDEKKITFDHLPYTFQQHMIEYQHATTEQKESVLPFIAPKKSLDEQLEMLEKTLITDALEQSNGNITKASKILKIPRQNLNYKIKKYNIATEKYKEYSS